MPRIPSIDGMNLQSPQPSGAVASIGAGDPGAMMAEANVAIAQGGAAMAMGGQFAARQKEFEAEAKREQLKVDTLRAEDAMTKARERELDHRFGETGYTKVQGVDALSRPVLKDYTTRFDNDLKNLEDGLGNDDQKALFRARADVLRIGYREGILRHLQVESKQAAKQQFEGTMVVEIKAATANWDKPAEVGLSIERIRAGVERMAADDGWSPAYKEAKTREALGKVHDAVIDQMIKSDRLVDAQNWYKDHRNEIDAATAKELQAKTVDAAQREVFNGLRASFLAVQDSPQGLKDLMKSVQGAPNLKDESRNQLTSQILSRQHVLEVRAQTAQQHADAVATRTLSQFQTAILSGREFTQADAPMLEQLAKTNPAMAPTINALLKTNQEMAEFRGMSLEKQQKIIADDAVRVRTGDLTDRVRDARKAIFEASIEQRKKDPATWAVQVGAWDPKSPQAQPIDWSSPDKVDPAVLKARVDAVRGLAYGAPAYAVPVKPATNAEVLVATSMMAKMNPAQRTDYLATVATKFGKDVDGFKAWLGQIAPDQPVIATAALRDIAGKTDPRQAQAAAIITAGQAILEPPRQEDGKPTKGNLLTLPHESKMRADFDERVRNAYGFNPEDHNVTFQVARAAYAKLTADSSAADKTVIDQDAWKKAVDIATGGVHTYRGRKVVVPWGMPAGEFEDKTYLQVKSMERAGALPAPADRLLDLPLVSVGQGRYVFMEGDKYVMAKDGKGPLVVDLTAPLVPGVTDRNPRNPDLARGAAARDQKPRLIEQLRQ